MLIPRIVKTDTALPISGGLQSKGVPSTFIEGIAMKVHRVADTIKEKCSTNG